MDEKSFGHFIMIYLITTKTIIFIWFSCKTLITPIY